ncbi:hypothetical protein LTR62_005202 [Meristemomyces frigidus]|uniref:SGS-domain-containing protein n=1 Tax=Meristemomyces frigidus TaxID=1508187 RepID=A0AAN7TQ36_9PEZI|nr:hypothetical protein LTR62_005202 [Meristemomyces frigidus]
MDHASAGKTALAASDYTEAIIQYTKALARSPTSPLYLIQRSIAYQRAKRYPGALNDANHAVIEARKRAKREHIVEAQFRRGVALYSLERYGDAEFVLGVVKRMDEKHKAVDMWLGKTKISLAREGLEEGKRICRVGEVPDVDVEGDGKDGVAAAGTTSTSTPTSPPDANGASVRSTTAPSATNGGSTQPTAAPSQPAQIQQTPADKIRHDWYQNNENVYFTLLAKGVPKDNAHVEILPKSLSITFPLTTGSSYDFSLDPLFNEVDPEKSSFRILSTKIEVTLAKKTQSIKWRALESDSLPAKPTDQTGDNNNPDRVMVSHAQADKPPAYPTSSKSGPKNWDAAVASANKALHDPSAKEGSLANDETYDGGDEANHFFKQLFAGSSPEVRRAMTKSYLESNGTALSTNWDEVKKGKVETSPPEGMEAKSWDR